MNDLLIQKIWPLNHLVSLVVFLEYVGPLLLDNWWVYVETSCLGHVNLIPRMGSDLFNSDSFARVSDHYKILNILYCASDRPTDASGSS